MVQKINILHWTCLVLLFRCYFSRMSDKNKKNKTVQVYPSGFLMCDMLNNITAKVRQTNKQNTLSLVVLFCLGWKNALTAFHIAIERTKPANFWWNDRSKNRFGLHYLSNLLKLLFFENSTKYSLITNEFVEIIIFHIFNQQIES